MDTAAIFSRLGLDAAALQSGELTAQELNMGVQLIESAVNNPSLYPQLRKFAVQQGIAGEEDLPQHPFDVLLEGVVVRDNLSDELRHVIF